MGSRSSSSVRTTDLRRTSAPMAGLPRGLREQRPYEGQYQFDRAQAPTSAENETLIGG